MRTIRAEEGFASLLMKGGDWLSGRFLKYALKDPDYKNILVTYWHSSFDNLTELLISAFKLHSEHEKDAFKDVNLKNSFSYLVQSEIIKYRNNGFDVRIFLTFMKLYRRSYKDFITEAQISAENRWANLDFAEKVFDHIELILLSEWSSTKLPNSVVHESSDENLYVTVFSQLFAPIILINSNGLVTNVNQAARQLFPGLKPGTCLYNSSNNIINELHNIVTRFNKVADAEYQYQTTIRDQSLTRHFKVICRKLLDKREVLTGTIIMFQDLTEQYFIEENLQNSRLKAEESDRLKTAFLANMSHEIRTPMNAIIGFTDLLLNDNNTKHDKNEFLKLIRRSCNDLLNIIEDIIDIAKMESKQYKIKLKTCKPYDILIDLKAVLKETLRRFGEDTAIEIKLNVDEELVDTVLYTDGERLKQVISNLLNNAAKFTNKGIIEFGFRKNMNFLQFFVRDTGFGIPDHMKEKIFDRFIQIEEHQQLNIGGAGLGLAISKNIVNLLGGKIWVESQVNKGSAFYFDIPILEIPTDARSSKESVCNDKTIYNWKNKTILIAEDDEINFIFMRETLGKSGASIVHAPNGISAIDIVETNNSIDLILMDMKMPGVGGLEATKYIVKIKPHIPVIALTAYAMEGDKNKCLTAGCCAYITKPVDLNKLKSVINTYICGYNITPASTELA